MKGKDFTVLLDENGEEIRVPNSIFEQQAIPQMVKEAWNNADQLALVVKESCQLGFHKDVFKAAVRLTEIDKNKERATVLYGYVLTELEKYNQAQEVFEGYLKDNKKPSSLFFAYYAGVFKDIEQQREYLFKSLKLDPNNIEALKFWVRLHLAIGGEEQTEKALKEVVKIKNSRIAQILLGGHFLQNGRSTMAIKFFKHSLSIKIDEYALFEISNYLGIYGYLKELFALIDPIYNPKKHGVSPGINLLEACRVDGQPQKGWTIIKKIDTLPKKDTAPYREHLVKYANMFKNSG